MSTFMVTFGQQYRHEPHPAGAISHPDGWVEIEAETELEARHIAVSNLTNKWAFIYPADDFRSELHPLGCLARFDAKGRVYA